MRAILIESQRSDTQKLFKIEATMESIPIQGIWFTESKEWGNYSEINAKLEEIDWLKKLKERYKTPINGQMWVSELVDLNWSAGDRMM